MFSKRHTCTSALLAWLFISSTAHSAVTIQENSQGFCGFDGQIANTNGGFSGPGYVDIEDSGGRGIDYLVKVPADGDYTLTFRYANDGSTSSAIKINGSSSSFRFPNTDYWWEWALASKEVSLDAGDNTIRIQATGSSPMANIDWLSVSGDATAGACGGSSSSPSSASSSSVVSSSSESSSSEGDSSSSATSDSSSSWSDSSSSETSSSSSSSVASSSSSSEPPEEEPGFAISGFATVPALGVANTTGGAGGPVVTVSTFSELQQYVTASGPYIIRVEGDIEPPGSYVKLSVASDKSIIGVGESAHLRRIGFRVGGDTGCTNPFNANTDYVSNVIIRNLTFSDVYDEGSNPDGDGITVECFSHHVWVDHNTFIYSAPTSSLTMRIDGAVDIKRGADWATVSWNHFYEYNKTALVGHSDSNGAQDAGRLHVTYHHNYFENTHQRHPRVRFGDVHIYNNYLFNDKTGPNRQLSYVALAGPDSELYLESNYFRVDSGELYVISEDSDHGAAVTFTSDNIVELLNPSAEWILEVNNHMAFDPASYYPYSVDDPETLPALVPAYAGAGKLTIFD